MYALLRPQQYHVLIGYSIAVYVSELCICYMYDDLLHNQLNVVVICLMQLLY